MDIKYEILFRLLELELLENKTRKALAFYVSLLPQHECESLTKLVKEQEDLLFSITTETYELKEKLKHHE